MSRLSVYFIYLGNPLYPNSRGQASYLFRHSPKHLSNFVSHTIHRARLQATYLNNCFRSPASLSLCFSCVSWSRHHEIFVCNRAHTRKILCSYSFILPRCVYSISSVRVTCGLGQREYWLCLLLDLSFGIDLLSLCLLSFPLLPGPPSVSLFILKSLVTEGRLATQSLVTEGRTFDPRPLDTINMLYFTFSYSI